MNRISEFAKWWAGKGYLRRYLIGVGIFAIPNILICIFLIKPGSTGLFTAVAILSAFGDIWLYLNVEMATLSLFSWLHYRVRSKWETKQIQKLLLREGQVSINDVFPGPFSDLPRIG